MTERSRNGEGPAGMVLVGVITGARGVRGEVKLKSFTAEPADVAAYGPLFDEEGARQLRLNLVGGHGDQLIARVDGVADRTQADALKGRRLFVPRAALPAAGDDEYYHADLIGLTVLLADGAGARPFGRVRAVDDFGAGTVLEIDSAEHGSVMVPFTREAVPEIDLGGGRLTVAALPGLLTAVAEADGQAAEARR